MVSKYFLPVSIFSFLFIYDFLCSVKLLSLIRSRLLIFALYFLHWENDLRKHCSDMSENILPTFSSSFMVSCLIFTSLNYLVHGVTEVLALLISYRLDLGDFLKWDLPASRWGLRSPFYCSLRHSLLYFTRVTPPCYPPGLEGS